MVRLRLLASVVVENVHLLFRTCWISLVDVPSTANGSAASPCRQPMTAAELGRLLPHLKPLNGCDNSLWHPSPRANSQLQVFLRGTSATNHLGTLAHATSSPASPPQLGVVLQACLGILGPELLRIVAHGAFDVASLEHVDMQGPADERTRALVLLGHMVGLG